MRTKSSADEEMKAEDAPVLIFDAKMRNFRSACQKACEVLNSLEQKHRDVIQKSK